MIRKSLLVKITLKLFFIAAVITLITGAAVSFHTRFDLMDRYEKQAGELGAAAAENIKKILELEIDSRNHDLNEFTAFNHRELSVSQCVEKWVKPVDRGRFDDSYYGRMFSGRNARFAASYSDDDALGNKIRSITDSFLNISSVGFVVVMDKKGFIPFHHSRNSLKLSGDLKKDISGCRSNRVWDYLGKAIDPDKITFTSYKRDTGENFINAFVPLSLKGEFWGGVVVAYNAHDIQDRILSATLLMVFFILSGALVICAGFNIMIRKNLRPINHISGIVKNITSGDFSQAIDFSSTDEIGTISSNLNLMLKQTSKTIDYLQTVASQISVSSGEVASTSGSIGDNTRVQVEHVSSMKAELSLILMSLLETNEYIDRQIREVTATVGSIGSLEDLSNRIAHSMKTVLSLSEKSVAVTGSGKDLIFSATDIMNTIVESSAKISGMINAIDDISDRIHLLSLNANIEAARAGDYGRGFAVVAGEIGKLADNTSQIVRQIHHILPEIESNIADGTAIVENIKTGSTAIIKNVIENSRLIAGVSNLTDEQAKNYRTMRETMVELEKRSRGIINVVEFQKQNSESIQAAMDEVLDFASETSSGAEQLAVSAMELALEAEDLNRMFEGYKLMHFGSAQ
ncbi:MAG: methyl-accepting chemotaxis protein [bacterium]|nr:methyl-accepting chemotaxis protein [bacterium]